MARKTTVSAAPKKEVTAKPVATKMQRVPSDTMIAVVNNRTNNLVYVSSRMAGMKVEWEEFGDIQYIELAELNSMRGTNPRFFTDNWIVVEPSGGYSPEEIYETLGVSRHYKHVVTPKTLDKLFDKPLNFIEDEMKQYSKGVKKLVYERAKQLRAVGKFDSISKYEAIERLATE